MMIAQRLRALRLQKDLTQGDIEERTGLKRFYVSRIEHGHTVPSIETLEKMASALQVPLYQLFYDGNEPLNTQSLPESLKAGNEAWGNSGEGADFFKQLQALLARMSENDRKLILHLTSKLARKSRS